MPAEGVHPNAIEHASKSDLGSANDRAYAAALTKDGEYSHFTRQLCRAMIYASVRLYTLVMWYIAS